MTREELCSKKLEALEAFDFPETAVSCEKYGNGHINDTFLVVCKDGDDGKKYILQRMNDEVFKDPVSLMKNVVLVTDYLREKIIERGGDPERETLNPVRTHDGSAYYKDSIGSYWRMYKFITDSVSLDKVRDADDFYQSGVAFGSFSGQMAGFDASQLIETIPDFQNTPKRYETFEQAVEADICGRAKDVKEEIEFFRAHKQDMEYCANALKEGRIPLRVTHNDTKVNNVLMNKDTNDYLAVIDLDTVMPGTILYDFGGYNLVCSTLYPPET